MALRLSGVCGGVVSGRVWGYHHRKQVVAAEMDGEREKGLRGDERGKDRDAVARGFHGFVHGGSGGRGAVHL